MIIRNCPSHASILVNCFLEINKKIKSCGHFLILFSLFFSMEKQKLRQAKAADQGRPKMYHTHATYYD